MPLLNATTEHLLRHPVEFARGVLKSFSGNQGLLLASAIANYALLSVVPLLILAVIALSHVVDRAELLPTLGRYLEWLVPSQSTAVLADVSDFLDNRNTIGIVLLVTMLFFSSLAFSVLEKAMDIIFAHRRARQSRHALVSAILPYSFVLLLSVGLLVITVGSVAIQSMARETISLFGSEWSLNGLSGGLLRTFDFAVQIVVLTAFYLVLPVGRTRLHHALLGAFTYAAIWALVRKVLVWYFVTLSKASVVYGSLTTAVVAMFSMEIGATLLLFGAQVISNYEQLEESLVSQTT